MKVLSSNRCNPQSLSQNHKIGRISININPIETILGDTKRVRQDEAAIPSNSVKEEYFVNRLGKKLDLSEITNLTISQ